jgi:excisionase family DNA binding protein
VSAPLTVPEVAAELKTSERYVLDELRRKNLRGIKLSGRAGWRVEADDLEAYKAAKANVRPVRRSA